MVPALRERAVAVARPRLPRAAHVLRPCERYPKVRGRRRRDAANDRKGRRLGFKISRPEAADDAGAGRGAHLVIGVVGLVIHGVGALHTKGRRVVPVPFIGWSLVLRGPRRLCGRGAAAFYEDPAPGGVLLPRWSTIGRGDVVGSSAVGRGRRRPRGAFVRSALAGRPALLSARARGLRLLRRLGRLPAVSDALGVR